MVEIEALAEAGDGVAVVFVEDGHPEFGAAIGYAAMDCGADTGPGNDFGEFRHGEPAFRVGTEVGCEAVILGLAAAFGAKVEFSLGGHRKGRGSRRMRAIGVRGGWGKQRSAGDGAGHES